MAGPGCGPSGCDFGKDGFLWIRAGVEYGNLGPSKNRVYIDHAVYQTDPPSDGMSPLKLLIYHGQSRSAFFRNQESNSRQIVDMVKDIPRCDDLKIVTVKACGGNGCYPW